VMQRGTGHSLESKGLVQAHARGSRAQISTVNVPLGQKSLYFP
jgi:hypothetical protein